MSQLKVKKPSKIDELKAMSPKDRNAAIVDLMMNMALFIKRSPMALFLSLGDIAFSSSILEGFLTFSI